jgi:diguanylate cyclase (GGDEF)-like protein
MEARLLVLELADSGHPLPEILREICLLVEPLEPPGTSVMLVLIENAASAPSLTGPSLPAPLRAAITRLLHDLPVARPAELVESDMRRWRRLVLEAVGELLPQYGFRLLRIEPFETPGTITPTGFIALIHDSESPPDVSSARGLALASELVHLALSSMPRPPGLAPDLSAALALTGESLPAATYVQRVGDTISTSYLSPRIESLLGWRTGEFPPHSRYWFARVQADDQPRVTAAVAHSLASGTQLDTTYRVQTRSGHEIWLRDMATRREISPDGTQVWCGILIDVTAEKATEAQLQSMAFYDSLTGLPNRRMVMDRLFRLLSDPQARATLLFLDLDGFKFINDGIGHAAGDELLVAVSRRLTSHLAGKGSLARFGGDEFVVILGEASTAEARAIAEALLAALRTPFVVDGFEINIEGSIGIATSSPDLLTPEALLRAADRALYRAKAGGRGEFAIFDPFIDMQGPDRQDFEAALRRALALGEFEVFYQPIVDIATREVLALEALVRWRHPERGLLPASDFITLADETGVIIPLGRWVLETACRQLKTWQDQHPGFQHLQMSVNLTGCQLRHSSLAADVLNALQASDLRPESLALEVRESDLLTASARIAEAVNALSKIGVKVTIDGFGNGLAALDAFTQVTIDHLKLDDTWVTRLDQEPQDDAVRGLVGLAHAIGLHVTARGVENDRQLAALQALGCQRAQGHYLAPPLTAEELEARLESDPAADAPMPGTPRLR